MLPRVIRSGVTAQRICKNITFYLNDTAALEPTVTPAGVQARPLLLMLPWLGSQPHAVAKYRDIYFQSGFDVLVVESEVSLFLWPRWGLDYGARVLDVLQSEQFVSRPLLVHAFSIGAFTFTQLLVHVSQDTLKYQEVTQRIRGQIYDSLVMGSLERMAIGLGKTIFPRFENLVKHSSMLYFWVFKRHTVEYFNRGIDVFRNNPVTAPALFYFCENDALCDPRRMEEIGALWRTRGISVTEKNWKDSTHAGHLRRHPEEYLSTLEKFLQSLSLAPLRAKM